jgi:hypothetical protein
VTPNGRTEMSWTQACKAARADDTLVAIARGIVALNKQGRFGEARVGYLAFADRLQEIAVSVPCGYENILLWSLVN